VGCPRQSYIDNLKDEPLAQSCNGSPALCSVEVSGAGTFVTRAPGVLAADVFPGNGKLASPD
jgi:hypothetical protein